MALKGHLKVTYSVYTLRIVCTDLYNYEFLSIADIAVTTYPLPLVPWNWTEDVAPPSGAVVHIVVTHPGPCRPHFSPLNSFLSERLICFGFLVHFKINYSEVTCTLFNSFLGGEAVMQLSGYDVGTAIKHKSL